jgi:hypothetical protein
MSDQLNLEPNLKEPYLHLRLSRRQFLWRLSVLASGSLLAACQVRDNDLGVRASYDQVLASPQPVPAVEGTPATPAAQTGDLEKFLALSVVLTGFEELNPEVGRVYLESLQANSELGMTPAELYERAGFTAETQPTLEELNEAALFEEETARGLADKILEYWYTGVYDQPGGGEQVVATFVDALTWQALTYTKPQTICGPKSDFWAERPEVAPMPLVTQVSFQQEEASSDN